MKSALETALLGVKDIIPEAEHEVDLLRSVLRRELGTPDQRNALIRIIKAHKPRRPVFPRLEARLGLVLHSRCTYIHDPAVTI